MPPKKKVEAEKPEAEPAAKPPKKGKQKAEAEPAAPPKKGKQKAEAASETDEPVAKKAKPDRKKPMRRPDHGEVIFCVEYAASNRSTCKECQMKIEKGIVRLGHAFPGKGDWDDISWRHFECHMEPLEISEEETLTAASQIERYDDLEKADQTALDVWFAKASQAPKKERPMESTDEVTAADAAEDVRPPPQGTNLTASFKEREEVGALGAKFDYRAKTWYVPFSKDATPFGKWLGADATGAIAAHNAVTPADRDAGGSQDVATKDAPEARPQIAPEAVPKMSVGALKEELSARGIDSSGKKAELVGRLKGAMENTPAPAEVPTNASGRRVDRSVPGGDQFAVYQDYDIKLSESSLVDGENVNKYYFIQVLQKIGGSFATYIKWGKIGEVDYGDKLYPFDDVKAATTNFEAKFNEKTRGKKDKSPAGEAWVTYVEGNFQKRDGL